MRQHARSISGTSQKAGSISSDGMIDEEDDEPFSATNSAVVTQGPKQDVLPKRPQPGGRFPSDLEISTQRGLQAPLSPSSSSGFGDVQDRNVVAAAGALPGSGVGQHYGANPTSPTHAAMVNQYAKEDGVNPYTYQPIHNNVHHENQIPAGEAGAGLAATSLGGAALGLAGNEAYRKHEEAKAGQEPIDYRQRQEDKAAFEASTIAAPDTYAQQSEQQATLEATVIAAPDTNLSPIPAESNFMSGGRSLGDVSAADAIPTSDAHVEQAKVGPQSQDVPNPLEAVFRPLAEDLARPSLAAGQNHTSVQSISELHIPGEYKENAI